MPKLPFKVMVELEVRDKNGRIVKKHRQMSHSFLKQWLALLRGQLAMRYGVSAPAQSVVDETGTVRTYPSTGVTNIYYMGLCTNGDIGDVSQGIVVGVSNVANSINTYSLGGKIAHGTGSGQLQYGSHTYDDVSNPSGNILVIRVIRTFSNGSGATVTVYEIGLLVRTKAADANPYSFLIARDVLSTPVDVPNNMTLTVRYIFQITVS
jgi:hypothetical protein